MMTRFESIRVDLIYSCSVHSELFVHSVVGGFDINSAAVLGDPRLPRSFGVFQSSAGALYFQRAWRQDATATFPAQLVLIGVNKA